MARSRNWIALFLATFCLLSFLPAAAEEQFDLTVEMPLGGIFKYNQWVRLDVTVHNNSDEAFSGFVAFGEVQRLPINESAYRKSLTLQAGATKTVPIDIPAEYLMRGPTEVRLVRDDQLVASEKLAPFNPKGERTVGVLGDNNNAFHFLAIGSDQRDRQWIPFTVQHMKPETLSAESWVLKNLDILAIAELSPGQITPAQLNAIKEWVNRGGVLILSPGNQADSVVSLFRDFLPVKAGEGGIRTDLTELRTLAGGVAPPLAAIPVYNQAYPFFTTKQIGAGVLIFANYDVAAEPMASWQHNRQLWQKIIVQSDALESIRQKDELNPADGSLLSLSKFIPGINLPKASWIILIFAIYILLIAPILYFVLKRKDRHILAWGIIPIFAAVLSLSVYLIGRTMIVQANASYHVSKVFLLNRELAELQTASSFLSVSGGDYLIRADKGMLTVPVNPRGGSVGAGNAFLSAEDDGSTTISFRDVPYLSVEQAISSGTRNDLGSFVATLSVMGGRISGNVANQTPFAMDNLYLDLGMQRISLGAIKPGEMKNVDAIVEEIYLPEQLDSSLPVGKIETKEQYIDQLKQNATYRSAGQVRLIGITSQPIQTAEVRFAGNNHYWSVLVQNIRLQPNRDGALIYPYGTMNVSLQDQKGNVEAKSPNIFELIKGEATFALSINQAKVDATRVEIPLDQSPYRPFKKEIYHSRSGAWKTLGRAERVILTRELNDYVTQDGQILLRFSNPSDQRLSLPQPYFQVEGVEKST